MTKETGKQAVRRVYGLLSLLIAFVSAVLLWYTNGGPYWEKGFFGTRTLFIVGMLFCGGRLGFWEPAAFVGIFWLYCFGVSPSITPFFGICAKKSAVFLKKHAKKVK